MIEVKRKMNTNFEDLFFLYGQAFILSVWAHILPVAPVLLSLFILIGLDTFLGIWASIKLGRKLISGRSWRIFTKIFVMTAVMVAADKFHGIAKNIWEFDAISLIGLTFAIVEIVSILENASVILEKPLFKWVVEKFDSKNINKPKGG